MSNPTPQRIAQLQIVKLLLAISPLLTGTLHAAPADSATSAFTGTWKLNPSKSTLTDQMKVEAAGPNKYNLIFSGDNIETVTADGTDQPGLFGTTIAVTADAPDSWKVVRKKNGSITIIGLWKLSPDGNTLTDNFTGYRPDGTTSNLHYIYKRTAGTTGFPGTWESTTEDVNSAFELRIKPYRDDGLSFVYPGGSMIKSMKLDDKGYPGSGPNAPAGYTSSIKRVNAQTLQMTDRMKGKLFDTQKIELSPDGNTLTITTSIPGRAKPNIQVFDRE
jgi:hypothetical protein